MSFVMHCFSYRIKFDFQGLILCSPQNLIILLCSLWPTRNTHGQSCWLFSLGIIWQALLPNHQIVWRGWDAQTWRLLIFVQQKCNSIPRGGSRCKLPMGTGFIIIFSLILKPLLSNRNALMSALVWWIGLRGTEAHWNAEDFVFCNGLSISHVSSAIIDLLWCATVSGGSYLCIQPVP